MFGAFQMIEATASANLRTQFEASAIALAAASLSLLIFAYGDFAPSAQNLPHWMPGQAMWTRLAASVLLAACVGLFFKGTALPSALAVAAYQLIWVAIGAPPILSTPLSFGAWYGSVEALTSLSGTAILCFMLQSQARALAMPMARERAVRVAQIIFGLTCVFYGCSHFAFASYTAGMVPHWLPGRLGWAYFTGLAHVAAGLAIAVGFLPRLAAFLEAVMMSLFGLLVWVPSFLLSPTPEWAMPPKNQWSELVVNVALAASAWVVVISLSPMTKHPKRIVPRSANTKKDIATT
jgi:uncharacterized membrane protein YphA (DoxX/SURF4 family)